MKDPAPVPVPVAGHALDWDDVVALLAVCALPHEDLSPTHLPQFLVMRSDAGICGVIGLERFGTDALLRSLAVAPARRRRNLATRLVSALEQRARSQGLGALYLLTTTAAAFFAARGYRVIERSEVPATICASTEFVRLCPASALCMTKRLHESTGDSLR